jgi:RNA methyltransferase, TrmH family
MKGTAAIRSGGAAPPRVSESIDSRENRWLKRFRAALSGDSPTRGEAGEIAGVEGARLVESALHSGVEIPAVLFSDAGAKHLSRLAPQIPASARLLRTSDRLFASASGTETPQGIAALVRPRAAKFDDLVSGMALVLVLAGLQDPGNVGTLVRTAEAFGATGIAACAAGAIGTANPFAPKALRASAGSALRLPILRGISAPVLLAQLRVAGVRTYAACPEQASISSSDGVAMEAVAPWQLDWRAPVALLVGNEGAGLPADLVRSADAMVRIPQAPRASRDDAGRDADSAAESLNAGVAGSILLYEAARQRGTDPAKNRRNSYP